MVEYQYDRFDRPVTATYFASVAAAGADQPSYVITTTYDALGRPLSVTDSRGGTTEYTYDTLGQTVQIVSPEGTLNYEYDPVTGLVSRVYTSATDIRYTYDALGRLSTVEAVMIDGTTPLPPRSLNTSTPLTGHYSQSNIQTAWSPVLPTTTSIAWWS